MLILVIVLVGLIVFSCVKVPTLQPDYSQEHSQWMNTFICISISSYFSHLIKATCKNILRWFFDYFKKIIRFTEYQILDTISDVPHL